MTSAARERFVTDAEGKRVGVILDLKTYRRLRDAEEELADVRAYDSARARVHEELRTGEFSTLMEYRASRAAKRK
jgi:hypothetical protein